MAGHPSVDGSRGYAQVGICQSPANPSDHWVSETTDLVTSPANAMTVSIGFTVILSCIVIGSATAYGVFVTLVNSGLLSSYAICIWCKLNKSKLRLMLTRAQVSCKSGSAAMYFHLLASSLASLGMLSTSSRSVSWLWRGSSNSSQARLIPLERP